MSFIKNKLKSKKAIMDEIPSLKYKDKMDMGDKEPMEKYAERDVAAMEAVVQCMQDKYNGVPIKAVKTLTSKIPHVFTGRDLVTWIVKNLEADDHAEALHLARLLCSRGYLFPIDDHILTVRNDKTYYRFQMHLFWTAPEGKQTSIQYAVYLYKRSIQNKKRLELADYEAESLARLNKTLTHHWHSITLQAKAQAKIDKQRNRQEQKLLESQERAFWDVNRPAPGCVNTTEQDIKKWRPTTKQHDRSLLPSAQPRLGRQKASVSKVAESLIAYFELYGEFDSFVVQPEPTNPWCSDNTEIWKEELNMRDISQRRVKRWRFSIDELLKDPAGRANFAKFLEKEFSCENLKFWEACQDLRLIPQKDVKNKVYGIYSEFLAPGAPDPVNLACRVSDLVRERVEHYPDRYCFDEAVEQIFYLMKNDSYGRYVRSDLYKEFCETTDRMSSQR